MKINLNTDFWENKTLRKRPKKKKRTTNIEWITHEWEELPIITNDRVVTTARTEFTVAYPDTEEPDDTD